MKPASTAVALFLAAAQVFSQSLFPVRDPGEARDREYHVLHYKIEVSFDEPRKTVTGKVTASVTPFHDDFTTLRFDAEELNVSRVTLLGGGTDLRFDTLRNMLNIHLDRPYTTGDTITVSTEYSCTPRKGLYFTQPDSGYPDKPSQIWSQGEDMDNHFWFPCYDFPNDKATSEMIATVQSDYVALSNGKLVSVREDKARKTKTFHWSETRPHSSYLITLAAGRYAVLRDHAGKLPLEYYVYPGDTANARICFSQTPDMIRYFSEKIGFPYAWEKYAQVLIADFIEGGMENTSATSLLDFITVYDARVRVDNLPTSLLSHELAHQWWGDVVTCKDWRHIWLNESFASYFDPLYDEHVQGREMLDYRMFTSQEAGIYSDTTAGRKPIVSVGSFGTNVYPRGAAVLHMLRYLLGDKQFWHALNHYITKYQFQPVETNDLKTAIEEATGENLYWFFDEWVYRAGHPIFDVSYDWHDSSKSIALTVKQIQSMDSLTGVFRMPVDIEITCGGSSATHRVNVMSRDTTFEIPCASRPQMVIFDKGNWILKELKAEKGLDEWEFQASSAPQPVDRIRALQHFGMNPSGSAGSIPVVIDRSLRDTFWPVRREAVLTLGKLKPESDSLRRTIKDALLAAVKDPKSSVRNAAIGQLGQFRGADVVAALRAALEDSSYQVVAGALRSLTKADSANVRELLETYLSKPSYRNGVANAAMSMIATLDSARAVAIALEDARYGHPVPTRFASLNILSKYGKTKPEVIVFYNDLLKDKNPGIKSAAARTLGDIGDESTIPALQRIADDRTDEASGAARESIEKLRKKSPEHH